MMNYGRSKLLKAIFFWQVWATLSGLHFRRWFFVLIISSDDRVLVFLLFTKWISIAGFNTDRFGYNSAEVMLRDFHPKGHT